MIDLIAPCGIDCRVCDAYIATQNNDIELKQKLADDFKLKFGVDKPLSELDCDGCGAQGKHIGFCAVCGIRVCAFAKGYATCAECAEFPCEKGSFIWTNNSKSKALLEGLRS
ncbi:MAG: hypothetical protein CVU50_09925 [Candidatus Cloacimonetes bacterium HGW-Cloacimonetes-3]|jgi:hypothetical protein|nr:MAG: hypothetical protein CVU50_09925 [Candidatus Cloacimonetes bacterium HGW-Cloacimonetes-3]